MFLRAYKASYIFRLARAELDDGIKEEVAAEVIREWIVRVIHQNKIKVKSQLEKKISGYCFFKSFYIYDTLSHVREVCDFFKASI